jgi:hypothetical protein
MKKFLLATLALTQAVFAEPFNVFSLSAVTGGSLAAIPLPAVTGDSCLTDLTSNIEKAITGPCGKSLTSTTLNFTSNVAATAYYDRVCSNSCMVAVNDALVASEKSCSSSDQQKVRKALGRTFRASFQAECVKADGVYCQVKYVEYARVANKTFSDADVTNSTAKHLCSPCLKKQIEITINFGNELIDFMGVPASKDQVAKEVSKLLDVCPAGSTDSQSVSF